jgi:hypothetical protein
MTRFSASGPRISYTPIEGPKPFKQIVGLYDMWQALAPETRAWIASLFADKDKPAEEVQTIENPEVIMSGWDPNLDMSMTREEPAGLDQDLIDYGSNMVVGLPVEVGNKILVPETWDAPIISREDAQAEGKAESKKRRFAGMPELGETTYQAWGAL